MRLLLVAAISVLPFISHAQMRVAVDFSSRGYQILPSFLFLKVVKYRYYIKTGFSAGTFGAGEKEGKVIGSGTGFNDNEYEPVESSFKPLNFPADTMAKLVYYKEWDRGFALDVGGGRFFEFNNTHTLRIDFQLKAYFMRSLVMADYDPLHNSGKDYSTAGKFSHFAMSAGPEIFHAVRFTRKLTGYYGVKIPVFLPFESKNYQRLEGPAPIKGIKPFFSLGMSCAIGKTPEE